MFYKRYIAYCIFVLLFVLIFLVLIMQKRNTKPKTLAKSSKEKEKMIECVNVHSLYNNLVEKYSQLKSINKEDFILTLYSLKYIAFIPKKDLLCFFDHVYYYYSCVKDQLEETSERFNRKFVVLYI